MNKIPHKCKYCNKQLYLENRVYIKGEYYCKEHWMKKNRTNSLFGGNKNE